VAALGLKPVLQVLLLLLDPGERLGCLKLSRAGILWNGLSAGSSLWELGLCSGQLRRRLSTG